MEIRFAVDRFRRIGVSYRTKASVSILLAVFVFAAHLSPGAKAAAGNAPPPGLAPSAPPPGLAPSFPPKTQQGAVPYSGSGMGCDPLAADGARTSDWKHIYWDGWQYNGGSTTINGVQASIWNYSPWVDPANSGSYVYAWVMLTVDHGYGVDAPLVQNGWVEFPYGVRHTMLMWHSVGGGFSATYADPPKALKTYTNYEIFRSGGNFNFYVAGSYQYSTPALFTPTEAQIYGETQSFRSQMPGGHASSYDYEDLFGSQYFTNAWHYFMPGATVHTVDQNGYDYSLYFGHTAPSGGNLSIWDWDCQH